MFFQIKAHELLVRLQTIFLILCTFLVFSLYISGLYLNYLDYSAKSSLVFELQTLKELKNRLLIEQSDTLQALSEQILENIALKNSILELTNKINREYYFKLVITVSAVTLMAGFAFYIWSNTKSSSSSGGNNFPLSSSEVNSSPSSTSEVNESPLSTTEANDLLVYNTEILDSPLSSIKENTWYQAFKLLADCFDDGSQERHSEGLRRSLRLLKEGIEIQKTLKNEFNRLQEQVFYLDEKILLVQSEVSQLGNGGSGDVLSSFPVELLRAALEISSTVT